jgi:hypothetical protein
MLGLGVCDVCSSEGDTICCESSIPTKALYFFAIIGQSVTVSIRCLFPKLSVEPKPPWSGLPGLPSRIKSDTIDKIFFFNLLNVYLKGCNKYL